MQTCDVLIAGGGPAGSSCAWRLRRAGLDVLVLDRASFPRDKVCAGWITPQVVQSLGIDVTEYSQHRTLQPITAFVTGTIGRDDVLTTSYDRPVSFGIRRCEFDHFLLRRAGAKVLERTPVVTLRRDGTSWIVNDAIRTPMLVGAGGHFCPVAQQLDRPPAPTDAALVVARETEFRLEASSPSRMSTGRDRAPELYFAPDMKGYGWVVRKGDFLNIGFGHLDRRTLTQATDRFVAFLTSIGSAPARHTWQWHGHAYLLAQSRRPRVVDGGVLLAGDAAGLAYSQSGEGIRPAIESGLLAAQTILEANGRYERTRLHVYDERLRERFGSPAVPRSFVPAALRTPLASWLLGRRTFVRHIVLDRWFLHAHDAALAA